jgi:glycosyltransferase involved in cell wall biosynthesis
MVNLAVGLKQSGNEVSLLTYNNTSENYKEILQKNSITLYNFRKGSRFSLGPTLKIIQLQKKNDFDIICSYLFTPSFYTLLAKLFITKASVVVSERTFEGLVPSVHKKFTRRLYLFSKAIVTNSYHQAAVLKSNFKKFENKIFVIPNGVDLELFKPSINSVKQDSLKIICVGRVSQLKNTKTVIEAVHQAIKHYNVPIKVCWIGAQYEWIQSQTDYYYQCDKLIKQYGLKEQWEWVGQTREAEKYYAQSSLLVHASFGEGFPNVICEGLASGLPVIASNVFDHPQIIKEGTNGYLFNPENVSELTEKINKFWKLTTEQKRSMGLKARETAEKEFSNDTLARRYMDLFSALKK